MKLKDFYYVKDLSPIENVILNCAISWRRQTIKNYVIEKALGISKRTIIRVKNELVKKGYIFSNWVVCDKSIDLIDKDYNENYGLKIKKSSPLVKKFNKVFDSFRKKA